MKLKMPFLPHNKGNKPFLFCGGDREACATRSVVFDMVYFPLGTRFLNEARGRGLTTISGLEMLVAQGARQFEIWTGLSAPRALMEQAVRSALDHSGGG